MCDLRVGHGYDVHKLVVGRELILGGVRVPHSKGLLGHSDADVLIHAVMDSILGALSLGDIGKFFPDNDDKFKDISSMKLLEEVKKTVNEISRIFSALNFFEEHPKKQQKIIASNIEKTIFFIASPSMISLLSYTETFQKRPKKGEIFISP